MKQTKGYRIRRSVAKTVGCLHIVKFIYISWHARRLVKL